MINNDELNVRLREYVNNLDASRLKRWVDVSHKFSAIDDMMIVTIQGLGRMDAQLVSIDEKIMVDKNLYYLTLGFNDQFTSSYLWVLGAFEIVRTLHEKARFDQSFFPRYVQDLKTLKDKFSRLRIPLAKFSPHDKHLETDVGIAIPSFHKELGVAWRVSKSDWINRRDLSDQMLELFEEMK